MTFKWYNIIRYTKIDIFILFYRQTTQKLNRYVCMLSVDLIPQGFINTDESYNRIFRDMIYLHSTIATFVFKRVLQCLFYDLWVERGSSYILIYSFSISTAPSTIYLRYFKTSKI